MQGVSQPVLYFMVCTLNLETIFLVEDEILYNWALGCFTEHLVLFFMCLKITIDFAGQK